MSGGLVGGRRQQGPAGLPEDSTRCIFQQAMSGYRAGYIVGSLSAESVNRTLGELGEGAT
jgi:hypothetical protein